MTEAVEFRAGNPSGPRRPPRAAGGRAGMTVPAPLDTPDPLCPFETTPAQDLILSGTAWPPRTIDARRSGAGRQRSNDLAGMTCRPARHMPTALGASLKVYQRRSKWRRRESSPFHADRNPLGITWTCDRCCGKFKGSTLPARSVSSPLTALRSMWSDNRLTTPGCHRHARQNGTCCLSRCALRVVPIK